MIQILRKNPELRNEKDLNFLLPIIKEIEFFKNIAGIMEEHIIDVS